MPVHLPLFMAPGSGNLSLNFALLQISTFSLQENLKPIGGNTWKMLHTVQA